MPSNLSPNATHFIPKNKTKTLPQTNENKPPQGSRLQTNENKPPKGSRLQTYLKITPKTGGKLHKKTKKSSAK